MVWRTASNHIRAAWPIVGDVERVTTLTHEALVALGQSFAAVTVFVALVGLFYVPQAIDRARERKHVTVLDCHVVGGGPRVVSLLWTFASEVDEGRRATIATYELTSGRIKNRENCDGLNPTCMIASYDRRCLFVADHDHEIYWLDANDSSKQPVLIGQQPGTFAESMALASDDRTLFSLGFCSLAAWDVALRQPLWSRTNLQINALAICAETGSLICAAHGGEILELDPTSGETLGTIAQHGSTLYHLAISPDQKRMVAVDAGGQALLFHRCRETRQWCQESCRAISTGNRRMCFSPDSERLIGTLRDVHRLVVWDLCEQQPLGELGGHTGPILGAAFTLDGTLLSWGTDGTIRVWDYEELLSQARSREHTDVAG